MSSAAPVENCSRRMSAVLEPGTSAHVTGSMGTSARTIDSVCSVPSARRIVTSTVVPASPRTQLGDLVDRVLGRRLAVDGDDHVVRLEPGLLGRAAGEDRR